MHFSPDDYIRTIRTPALWLRTPKDEKDDKMKNTLTA